MTQVRALREEALKAPFRDTIAPMREHKIFEEPTPTARPGWVEELAQHMRLFVGCALKFTSGTTV
eukprot:5880742-Karenia_brevis.AAC.1